MRDSFYEQLDVIVDELSSLTTSVRTEVADATAALLGADTATAEKVIASAPPVADTVDELEERTLMLLATQQPVATDLRQLVASLRMLADLERMSALAVHIAKIARRRIPESAVPLPVQPTIKQMARVADTMIEEAAKIVANRDLSAAAALEVEDDEMDKLRRDLFGFILDDKWEHGTEAAIDLALLGRYYERLGDHAVNMARRVVFLVTGELPVNNS